MTNMFVFDDKLTLPCPDGFHVMDETEQSGIRFFGDSPGRCLSDPERHILISVGRKTLGGLSTLLINAKDAAKRMEASIRKPMLEYGYRLNGFAAKSVGSERAEGFSYEYESQGTGMYGESYVVKRDKALYYLNLYARKEQRPDSLEVWTTILSSAKWSETL